MSLTIFLFPYVTNKTCLFLKFEVCAFILKMRLFSSQFLEQYWYIHTFLPPNQIRSSQTNIKEDGLDVT